MLTIPDIRLAVPADAPGIAALSRDYIEHGLGWSWTPQRVVRALRDRSTNVAVVRNPDRVLGFGIMQYGDDAAHLALLAVHPIMRHRGLGARLVGWLEESARIAGIRHIRLEARADNRSAIAFYQRLGFTRSGTVAGYYDGVVDAARLEKRIW